LSTGPNLAGNMIKGLIIINALMFLFTLLLSPGKTGMALNPFVFLSPDNTSLFLAGATGAIPIERFGRWWTLIAASYLHGSILHILFNMLALRQLGPLVIQEYGVFRMFSLYTLTGIVGFYISYLAGVPFTIGASAAVCGLIGATLYYGKSRGGIYGKEIVRQVSGWIISLFLFGLLVPGINNWGHGGGVAAGILFGFLLGYNEKRKEGLPDKILALFCAVCTLATLFWAVVSGFRGFHI
jgi:rhomboid protease GluP